MSASYSPDISVVIPCFNALRWIGDTLQSVFSQQGPDLEVIVVDDGSTDGSADVVESLFPQVRVYRTENAGPSHARNVGTYAASGKFVQYVDADDMLAPNKLNEQLALLQHSGADIAYGDWQELGTNRTVSQQLGDDAVSALLTDFWCPPAGYLIRRGFLEGVGGWDERQWVVEDVRFMLQCALAGARFERAPGLAALYRVHTAGSLSTSNPEAFLQGCLRNAMMVEAHLTPRRRAAVLKAYSYVARASFGRDQTTFDVAYAALQRLQPGYVPSGPWPLAVTSRVVGYRSAEALAFTYRRVKRSVLAAAQRT
ncbi:MAG: glycosyltransferase family 2 protein [Chloroflexi bacterium]|nr:glycosyltransferase family 2 protein [Chloroflexota bacterium]